MDAIEEAKKEAERIIRRAKIEANSIIAEAKELNKTLTEKNTDALRNIRRKARHGVLSDIVHRASQKRQNQKNNFIPRNESDFELKWKLKEIRKEFAEKLKYTSLSGTLADKGIYINSSTLSTIILRLYDWYELECRNIFEHRKRRNSPTMAKFDLYAINQLLEQTFEGQLSKYFNKDNIRLKEQELEILDEIDRRIEEEREKERARKEELAALREIERERKKAEKDEEKAMGLLLKAQQKLKNEGNEKQIDRLKEQIVALEKALEEARARRDRALSMAQQTKCGYVYVISNIGSFGEGVFKIGLTRRLDPMERVHELGDASVPFPFDVHTFIFSEDAPALEAHLHRAFESRKVNTVNPRKEYFRVSLNEIKSEVALSGIFCEWTDEPDAMQYRLSQTCY